jgi:hypothetical protein
MKRSLRLISLLAVAAGALAAVQIAPAERAAAKTITADELRGHVRFLASDLLEGRGPATMGDRLAEQYVAAQLEGLGLKPGGANGSWFQPFDIVGVNGHPDLLSFAREGKGMDLKYHQDFVAMAGKQEPQSRLSNAEVVFVGYGIVAPEYQWDDYKGMDLRGKVFLMMNNDPDWDPDLFAGKTRLWYGRWDYKYEIAAKTGAVGAIIIHTTPSAGYPWKVVQTSWGGEKFSLPYEGGPQLDVKAWATEDASKRIAAMGGKDLDALQQSARSRDFKPVPLGVTVSTLFQNTVEKKQTGNVLGVLPGSDPRLAKQVVLYTAHHDHLGKKKDAKPGEDAIYNGARDNASGVASILSIGHAFTALPKTPRRTIMFAAVGVEEQGLLGSEYLAKHPPVPPGAFAANINIDSVNIWGRTKDIAFIGLGKSSLDGIVQDIAATQGRRVTPDALPDRGYFYRSDQFNLAKIGVPAAYFGNGLDFIGRPEGWGRRQVEEYEGTHYHQPSDELNDSWNLEGAVEDVQLCFYLGLKVSQADAMPEWKKGDEFEQARKKALMTVGQR